MNPAEALRLLEASRDKTTGSEEADDAAKLLEVLGWFPLAISQAGTYLRRTPTSLAEYLSKMAKETDRWQVLKEAEFDRYRSDVPTSLLETFSISMQRIRLHDEMAYQMMHILAYVNNQDIPFEMITAAGLFCGEGDKTQLGENKENRAMEALTWLVEFSFLRLRHSGRERQGTSYEMHNLVQEAARYRLRMKGSQDEAYFSNAALQIVAKLFPKAWNNPEAWADCEKYIAHARQVGEWGGICNRVADAADLLERVWMYLANSRMLQEQELVAKRVYELRRDALGEKHLDTIGGLLLLGWTYTQQSREIAAEPIFARVVALHQEILGEKHPATINSMINLETANETMGRLEKAESLALKVVELREEVLGKDHPDTAKSRFRLARLYTAQGRHHLAEENFSQALKFQRMVLGEKHPDTIQSLRELANALDLQGQHQKAEASFIQVLSLRRETLGEKHPDTIQSLTDLGMAYQVWSRFSDAEPLFVEALKLRQNVFGEKHPYTLMAMVNLASMRWLQGGNPTAEPMLVEALALLRDVVGDTHPYTLQAMHQLAHVVRSNWSPPFLLELPRERS